VKQTEPVQIERKQCKKCKRKPLSKKRQSRKIREKKGLYVKLRVSVLKLTKSEVRRTRFELVPLTNLV